MPKKELDLFQLTAIHMAKFCACSTKARIEYGRESSAMRASHPRPGSFADLVGDAKACTASNPQTLHYCDEDVDPVSGAIK
jgi:hypothetical protein